MWDLIAREAPGHGPVHLLLISTAELGFAWDGDEKSWVRPSLPPLRLVLSNISFLPSWTLGGTVYLSSCLRGKVFGVFSLRILKALYNYLTLPT